LRKRALGIGTAIGLCCVVVGGGTALAASGSGTPKGGQIQLFVQPGQHQGSGTIVITGAIGDYGTTKGFTAHGKRYSFVRLQQGTLVVDLTKIATLVNNTTPTTDVATCSASITETAPALIVSGTGLYQGARGTITITESIGFIGSRYATGPKKGQCNNSNTSTTAAELASVHGVGSVSF
jgi:hypothetical protein